MTAAELLRAAAVRVERGWAQNAFARNARGDEVTSHSPQAICWCALGAIEKENGLWGPDSPHDVAVRVLQELLPTSIGVWNDAPYRTAAEVVKTLREAADVCEGVGHE